jgi:DNA-binding PucR family transcriptional regulator
LSALTEIRDHDRAHHTAYWRTLRSYVLCDRNFNDAASQLNLHANTVRYRIERMGSTFNLDLTNPATFIWVAVQIHHPSA